MRNLRHGMTMGCLHVSELIERERNVDALDITRLCLTREKERLGEARREGVGADGKVLRRARGREALV